MKRIFLCLLLILSLCACSQEKSAESLPAQFNASAATSYLGNSFDGEVISTPDGEFSVVMISPEELKGLRVEINSNGCRVTDNGLELDYPTKKLAELCPFVGLYEAVEASRHIAPEVNKKEQYIIFNYKDGKTEYKFTVERESGKITKIEADKTVFEMR